MPDVTIVIPVKNGAPWLARALAALAAQLPDAEIVIVDDGSVDDSMRIVERFATQHHVRVLRGPGRGAAAALNVGVAAASCELIAQIDQDVEVLSGWAMAALAGFDGPRVAAVQGCYVPDPNAALLARVMALDLVQRYEHIEGATTHVCTGNTIYRRSALLAVGLFDETLGYGYDNDMSYRLLDAGWELRMAPDARSLHHWRQGVVEHLRQQYGFGYGRLELVARHPGRIGGDSVSRTKMMAHPVVLAGASVLLLAAAAGEFAGVRLAAVALTGATLLMVLAGERLHAGIRAVRQYGDPAGLLFPIVHLARDAAWVAAIVTWITRRASGQRHLPEHSMRPRQARTTEVEPT